MALDDVVVLNVDTNTLETAFDDLQSLPNDVVSVCDDLQSLPHDVVSVCDDLQSLPHDVVSVFENASLDPQSYRPHPHPFPNYSPCALSLSTQSNCFPVRSTAIKLAMKTSFPSSYPECTIFSFMPVCVVNTCI